MGNSCTNGFDICISSENFFVVLLTIASINPNPPILLKLSQYCNSTILPTSLQELNFPIDSMLPQVSFLQANVVARLDF